MSNTIKCKYCGKEIEITEALLHEVEERVSADLLSQHKKELEDLKRETEEKAKRKAAEETDLKLRDKENEAEELRKQNKDLLGQILQMNKTLRELKRQDERRELEYQKKLDDEAEKIRQATQKSEGEKASLKIAELEKKLSDTERALVNAQKKTRQGSQQLQGEVLELELEMRLKNAFHNDQIEPVGKGVSGGDIIQRVKNSYNQTAGIILWETKRAKWTPSWLPKLREDARKVNASLTVLVSEELPKEVESFDVIDGVIITSYAYALPLAELLRRQLMQLALAKSTTAHKDEKLERLYGYLQSDTFRHRFEAYVEGIVEMQNDLETEKRSMERLWKRREAQISRTIGNISKMYGELQGIMGNALPDIKPLSLPEGNDMHA